MDWKTIPSLAALRAFEATARLESLSGAAGELNVTHAAVSQHLRTLEAEFGCTLMQRAGRGMQLTDNGRRLAAALADGFGTIADGVVQLRDQQANRPLVVCVTPSFAESWLMPRLGGFWQKHPDIQLSVQPGFSLVDLKRDGVDLAIRYGRGSWEGLKARKLVSAAFVACAVPKLRPKNPADIPKAQWFFEPARAEFRVWAESQGLVNADTPWTAMETNQLILSAVRAGYGFGVQNKALIQDDLTSGRLISVCDDVPSDLGYYVVTREGFETPAARTFIKWLFKSS
ncbi:LysR family transcriptional regulator [Algirhabdus cladophorae]|uniref:LysR family transcriptional regulator n=1 Tax=Algirhabdus cladophorae TaxID=3377108 RepID=UPI003B847734